jgi:hypothetical protein
MNSKYKEIGLPMHCSCLFSVELIILLSLERINAYLSIDQEAKPTHEGVPPAYWPASGSVVVENLRAKYSVDGPEVRILTNFWHFIP